MPIKLYVIGNKKKFRIEFSIKTFCLHIKHLLHSAHFIFTPNILLLKYFTFLKLIFNYFINY